MRELLKTGRHPIVHAVACAGVAVAIVLVDVLL